MIVTFVLAHTVEKKKKKCYFVIETIFKLFAITCYRKGDF